MTTTSNTSAGHSNDKGPEECIEGHLGPQYHETGLPVGVIAPDFSDDGLYHPGLLHSSRLQIVDTALKGAKSSGLPYVSMTFECLCHHINSGPRIALVILTNHAKHLTVGESEMLSVLCELYCNEKMAYDPDPLVWIQSRDSVEGMEAIQTIGGQTLGYPQLVICTPSLRGVKAPLVVEKFPDNFMSVDFVEAMAKAKEAVQVVQINRTKRNEDLALKAQQDEEYLMSAKADASKDKKRDSLQSSIVIDIDKTIDEPAIHKIGKNVLHYGDESEKEKQIRRSRALRVQPEVEVGVEIKIFSPLGLLRRTFPKTGFYQEVYDWLGSNENLPLYFLLEHQATHSLAYPKDNLETQGHVLRLVEKDENEMKEIMYREEVTFHGTMPRSPKQNPMVGTLGAKEEERKKHRKEKKKGERKEDRKEKRKEGETKEDRKKKRQEVERKEGRKEKQQEGERKEGRKEKRQEDESKEGRKEKIRREEGKKEGRKEKRREGESKEDRKEKRREGESKEDRKEKRREGESKEDRKEKKIKLGVVTPENEEKNKDRKKASNEKEVSLTTMPQGDTSATLKAKEEGGEGSATNRRKRRREKEKERKNKTSKHE